MKQLSALEASEARRLVGVVFDLDDTLLDHGALTEVAYGALFRLREAGLALVACTGRPAGWADVVMRQWPIDAAVAENGAVGFVRAEGRVVRVDRATPEERDQRRARLRDAAEAILRQHPELALADDNGARHTDVTIDIGEHRKAPADVVASAREAARALGIGTFVSSVHLHLTFEAVDKASGTVALLASDRADATAITLTYAYVGDSENDASAFAAFKTSFGVANVRACAGRLSVPPRFAASETRGRGFAEIARRIVELRDGSTPKISM